MFTIDHGELFMTARDFALLELDSRRLPHWTTDAITRRPRVSQPPADPRDRALAEQIVTGVMKNLLLLEFLLEHYSQRKLKQIDQVLQKIAVIALYQLRFLDRIPPSAAVDQAVEQAKRFGRARGAGFINAVLRRATREQAPHLPDPQVDPASYARIALSHPPELFSRLQSLVGTADALTLCRHDNTEPPTIVRLLPGVSIESLQDGDITVQPHSQTGLYVVQSAKQPRLAEWARLGIAQVQDPTAASVVPEMPLARGQTVLDRCAGLGTKTLQLLERVGPDGKVVAIDPNERRCEGLRNIASARNLANLSIHSAAWLADLPDDAPSQFDAVLADVPCSNSGTFPRRPEARYFQRDRDLRSLEKLQLQILNDTASAVKPGGHLVYSTCSIWPEENERIIERFLASHPEFQIVSSRTTLPVGGNDPTLYHDGGYACTLVRTM
jgi:16S rRNA (cytosine967-C5)-methyltransferase